MATRSEMLDELHPIHNDICIVYDSFLARLVGFHEDEMDYYYRVRTMTPEPERLCSAVGHIVSLKGIYPADRYRQLDWVFEHNGAPKSDTFVMTADDWDGSQT